MDRYELDGYESDGFITDRYESDGFISDRYKPRKYRSHRFITDRYESDECENGCHDWEVLSYSFSDYSFKKGLIGTALFGPVGAVAGIGGRKGYLVCKKCGRIKSV